MIRFLVFLLILSCATNVRDSKESLPYNVENICNEKNFSRKKILEQAEIHKSVKWFIVGLCYERLGYDDKASYFYELQNTEALNEKERNIENIFYARKSLEESLFDRYQSFRDKITIENHEVSLMDIHFYLSLFRLNEAQNKLANLPKDDNYYFYQAWLNYLNNDVKSAKENALRVEEKKYAVKLLLKRLGHKTDINNSNLSLLERKFVEDLIE